MVLKNRKSYICSKPKELTVMTELVITLKDSSYLPNIRRIVKSLVGVEKVSVPRKKRLSRYEQSLLDVKEGRVYEAKDVDDLFKQILD